MPLLQWDQWFPSGDRWGQPGYYTNRVKDFHSIRVKDLYSNMVKGLPQVTDRVHLGETSTRSKVPLNHQQKPTKHSANLML
eukprot:15353780-Ditylum_brightwellii.AAC.1